MSRGRRLLIAALIGLAVTLVGGWQLYEFYQTAEQQHATYNYQPASKPGFRIDAATKAPAQHYKPSCNNPDNNSDADLCAQWAAVEQVAESNRLSSLNLRMAVLTLFCTLVGTLALVWTLSETRMVARRELRAYLCLQPVRMDEIVPVGPIKLILPVENTGNTPANRYLVQMAWKVTAEAPTSEFYEGLLRQFPVTGDYEFSIGPRQVKEMPYDIDMGLPWRMAVIGGAEKFYFLGRITYIDAFGYDRVTEFFYEYTTALPNRLGQVKVHNKIT